MQKIKNTLIQLLNSDLITIIISNPKNNININKIKIRPVLIKNELLFQIEEYVGKQVLHSNNPSPITIDKILEYFHLGFKQLEAKSKDTDTIILISKKGKFTIKTKNTNNHRIGNLDHNKNKQYIMNEGDNIPFLQDLGIMTCDNKIIKGKYDKFKQINRFLEFIQDILIHLDKTRTLNIIDFGCGKSYLTFAIYYYLVIINNYSVNIIGLDLKEDVIDKCNNLADKYKYSGLKFIKGDIKDYKDFTCVDMVVTLHACDTATDYALAKAVEWNAKIILSVPCCQHELNQQLNKDTLSPIFNHGLIKERMAALITDSLRADLLEIKGYKIQLLEFIDMEHTAKNILIRGVYTGIFKEVDQYKSITHSLQIQPTLEKLLL